METRLTLSVPGSSAGVRQAADGFEAFAAAQDVPSPAVCTFQVAMDEVLSNIVKYGLGASGPERRIEIEICLEAGVLEVAITDDGPAFNPLEAVDADTTQSVEDRPVGGLGIMVVRKLMRSVEYQRREGHNRLVFGRSIEP